MYEPEPDKKVDAPLVLRDSGDDWWVIERANHDGRVWLERDAPNAMSLHCSARIGNADIEGTADEMRRIADAIKSQSNVSHRRCAARTTSEGVLLWSPRNSLHKTLVPHHFAQALADEIREKLPAQP